MKKINIILISFILLSCGKNNRTTFLSFYSLNKCPTEFEVYVDGKFRGSVYESGLSKGCENAELKIELLEGDHFIKIGNECVNYTKKVTLEKNECYLFNIY